VALVCNLHSPSPTKLHWVKSNVGIAGGVDTTSDAPISFGDGLRKAMLEANNAKKNSDYVKALKN